MIPAIESSLCSPLISYMPDFSLLHKRARHDIRICIQAWSATLRRTLGERLGCMYALGSAVRAWDSPIDYVPVISDVDIHVYLRNKTGLLAGSEDHMRAALDLSRLHERTFRELEPEPMHTPRSQVVVVNGLLGAEWYIPPRQRDVRPVVGELPELREPPPERYRFVDRWRLEQDEEFVRRLPMRTFDRTGLDLWYVIRDLTWRVSPAPARLLTQTYPVPADVWGWNRTRLLKELESSGYDTIASHYCAFYERGWDLFLSDFTDTEAYRQMILHGHTVLRECLRHLKSL
ncbi:MAG: hypothetical protein ACTSVD_09780 [Candidatus Thorarchaeota archaeon]